MKNKIFIEKANKLHDCKYDYSLVEYENSKSKVKIICNLHGVFIQTPNNHLSGKGCSECGGKIRYTTELFIEKARIVHDNYEYSLVDYVSYHKKVKIICKEHGVFEQTPASHLAGKGCSECAGNVRLTTSEFIRRARKVHGDTYDYSLVDCVGRASKVKIICYIHGTFEQTPASHLAGKGCSECAGNGNSNTNDFIKKAKLIHGDTYDYSLVDYKNSKTLMQIICKEHGVFKQNANNHLQGKCCSECAGNVKSSTNEFIEKAKLIHGDTYDYSLVDYKTNITRIQIICKKHGIFGQTPHGHLNGKDCPKCSSNISKPETEVFEFVKTISDDVEQSNRKIIKPKELDVYCPSENIAIEFNGLYWHSSKSIETHESSKHKHLFKTLECEKQNIRLFHIFENEWNDKKEIWKSVLTRAFNKSEFKEVTGNKPVSKAVAKNFFNKNSLDTTNEAGIGYYSDNELIAVLSNDILVYKLFNTSDIQPDILKINLRFPENVLQYKLIENTEPQPHFHNGKKFVKSENAFMSYANNLNCIWDCGYKLYGKI